MSFAWRIGVFAVVFLLAAAWVASNDGEHAAMVRHFLSNLLRHLF